MSTLKSALESFSKTLETTRQLNGENGQEENLGGMATDSPLSGMPSRQTFGLQTTVLDMTEEGKQTGLQRGAITAEIKPQSAAEATELAQRLVADLLPHSLQAWLQDMESHEMVALSVGGEQPKPPVKTTEMVNAALQSVKSLSEILEPSRNRGPELDAVILQLFAAFNLYSGDQGKLNAMVQVWADELEEFPMFAIRKAYKWSIRSGDKMPSLASFIRDVRLAIGTNVLKRKQLLERWILLP